MESVRTRPILCCTIALMAAAMGMLLVINVAELQSATAIVVRAQAPESSERPALGISLLLVAGAAIAPLTVLSVAFWKHWSLAHYLAWIVAFALLMVVICAAASFTTYRYWRDHQRVAEQLTTRHLPTMYRTTIRAVPSRVLPSA